VGRYSDFTRSFLPRHESNRARWSNIILQFSSPEGVPPIDVYRIGDTYFVRDGNHRVSVARALGNSHIEAYVTPIQTKVPLSPDVEPDDLIIIEEYADFLERTGLDESRPEAEFTVTTPGRYLGMMEQIEVHRYYLQRKRQRPVSFEDAAADWYEDVYLPLVAVIRERDILHHFEGLTETDLYVWLARYREELAETLGWWVEPEAAAGELVARHSPRPQQVLGRVSDKVLDAIVPPALAAGPAPGHWREERQEMRVAKNMFRDILVPVSGKEEGWRALEQALLVATHEEGRVHGLYVVPGGRALDPAAIQQVQEQFEAHCRAVGIPGELRLETGVITDAICNQGQWTDLMVLRLTHPPGTLPSERLSSGFSILIRRCSRPILAVPGEVSQMRRPLLAYDGSRKAQEALFVATYLAAAWDSELTVLTVAEPLQRNGLKDARQYLEEQKVPASFIKRKRQGMTVGAIILEEAAEAGCDLIIMGGYGYKPVLEVVLGSSVDEVLQRSKVPVLICR
jgi:nucleotide-binding universal stress UspA family protein